MFSLFCSTKTTTSHGGLDDDHSLDAQQQQPCSKQSRTQQRQRFHSQSKGKASTTTPGTTDTSSIARRVRAPRCVSPLQMMKVDSTIATSPIIPEEEDFLEEHDDWIKNFEKTTRSLLSDDPMDPYEESHMDLPPSCPSTPMPFSTTNTTDRKVSSVSTTTPPEHGDYFQQFQSAVHAHMMQLQYESAVTGGSCMLPAFALREQMEQRLAQMAAGKKKKKRSTRRSSDSGSSSRNDGAAKQRTTGGVTLVPTTEASYPKPCHRTSERPAERQQQQHYYSENATPAQSPSQRRPRRRPIPSSPQPSAPPRRRTTPRRRASMSSSPSPSARRVRIIRDTHRVYRAMEEGTAKLIQCVGCSNHLMIAASSSSRHSDDAKLVYCPRCSSLSPVAMAHPLPDLDASDSSSHAVRSSHRLVGESR